MGLDIKALKFDELISAVNIPNITAVELWERLEMYFSTSGIAKTLHVALIEVDISIEPNIFALNGRDDIYTARFSEEGADTINFRYPMANKGSGSATVYAEVGHTFSDDEKESITFISFLCHQMMSRIRLNNDLDRVKYIDILTGLYNTPGISMQGKKLEALSELEDYSMVFMNLKSFGAINKIYGNRCGDLILIDFAKYLYGLSIRDGGYAARLGGDNFLAIIQTSCLENFLSDIASVDVTVHLMDKDEVVTLKSYAGVYCCDIGDDYNRSMQKVSMAKEIAKKSGNPQALYFSDEMLSGGGPR